MAGSTTTRLRKLVGAAVNLAMTPITGPTGLFQFGESNLVDKPKDGEADPDLVTAAGSIIKSQVAERWVTSVSRGITPEALDGYLTEAITGNTLNLFTFYEEMEEKWPELRVALYKHKVKAARRNLRIVPPDRAQNPALAKNKADFANLVFAGIPDWHRTAFDLMDAVGKGLSAAEINWQIGTMQGQQSVIIDSLQWVNHRHLGWWWDKPELQLFPDLRNRAAHIDVPERKFIVFHHLSKSGHASRAAILRPLAWSFLIYLYALKDWSTLAETFGIDVAHAFCNENATQEQRNKILMHLSRIAARAGVFDAGTVIQLQRAAASGSAPQEGLVKYCSERAIEALLGSTLGTQAGEKGARSLGLVQQDETEEIVDWTCLLFSGTLTGSALHWLMDFNFTEPGDNPVCEMPGANRRDLQALSNVLNILARLGVQIPMAWTQAQFDVPLPKPGLDGKTEPILIPQQSGSTGTDPVDSQSAGEALTARAPARSESGPGADFASVTENQAQRALDALVAQAVREGQADGTYLEILDPIKRLVHRDMNANDALRKLAEVKGSIEPKKLTARGTELLIMGEMLGRLTVIEHQKQ